MNIFNNNKFVSHILALKKSIVYRLFTLKKVRHRLDQKDALTLFKSNLQPYFDQGDIYYDVSTHEQLKSLPCLQGTGMRMVYGKKCRGEQMQIYLRKSNLLTTTDQRHLSLDKHAHRLSFDRTNLRQHQQRSMRADQRKLLKLIILKDVKYERAFPYKGCKLWNTLPEDIKELKNLYRFRLRVSRELLQGKLNFPE